MALFSTLASSSKDDTTGSLSSIPTVIQLYTSNALILDDTAKAGEHAVLSYQAVEVGQPLEEGGDVLFGHKRKTQKSLIQDPNLGVWNCCVPKKSQGLVDQLLDVPNDAAAVPTFCFTIDLKDPSRVEPTVSLLQEALVRHLIQHPPSKAASATATTSLFHLRSAQFGLAPEDDESRVANVPDDNDKEVMFALMICAIVSPASALDGSDAYKEKQAQALLLYHLRRYAASLKATLCFVRSPEESSKEQEEKQSSEQPTMTVDQLAHTWLELARGEAVTKEESLPLEDTKEPEETASYGPGTQEDLIETVLLRNAHCEGEWNASKDSLWRALPSPKSESDKIAGGKNASGDEEWLSQLRGSIGSLVAPAEPTAVAEAPKETNKQQDKKEDAEVSSFFENLLKKP